MSVSVPDTTRPSPQHLAAQICRWLSQQLAMVYNDDGRTTPASLYAGPLPDRSLRLSTAVGVEHLTDQAGDGSPLSSRMLFTLECRAATRDLAGRTLAGVRRVLRPGDQQIVFGPSTPSHHGGTTDLQGIIGAPRIGTGAPLTSGEVWRVIDVEVSGEPALADVEASGQSHDGLGSALMTIAVEAVPDVLAAPLPVLDVWHPTGVAGVGEATVQVIGVLGTASLLRLRTRAVAGTGVWTTRDIDMSATTTVAALRDAIINDADPWLAEIASAYEATVLDRDPVPLAAYEPWWVEAQALGTGSKRQVRVWA